MTAPSKRALVSPECKGHGLGASPPRVLCADDNPVNRELARVFLERAGSDPVLAENGAEALAWAKAEPFGLIILDLRMPVMDGFDAAKAISALPHPFGSAPLVALSAEHIDSIAEHARACGFIDILAKPARFEVFASLIQKWTQPEKRASVGS